MCHICQTKIWLYIGMHSTLEKVCVRKHTVSCSFRQKPNQFRMQPYKAKTVWRFQNSVIMRYVQAFVHIVKRNLTLRKQSQITFHVAACVWRWVEIYVFSIIRFCFRFARNQTTFTHSLAGLPSGGAQNQSFRFPLFLAASTKDTKIQSNHDMCVAC